jgi:DNA-binding NarL/FixJ family response regulator
MPTMNGFETLKAIKHQTSLKSKIVVFTNVVDKEKIEEAMNSGADEYLIKANVDPSDVIDTINKVLQTKPEEMPEPIEIKPGLNIFKLKNPLNGEYIEISVNIKI